MRTPDIPFSTRDYAGCPHCGGPVNVKVEVDLALVYYLSTVIPHLQSEARKVVDTMVYHLHEDALRAMYETDADLGLLDEVDRKPAKPKRRRSR